MRIAEKSKLESVWYSVYGINDRMYYQNVTMNPFRPTFEWFFESIDRRHFAFWLATPKKAAGHRILPMTHRAVSSVRLALIWLYIQEFSQTIKSHHHHHPQSWTSPRPTSITTCPLSFSISRAQRQRKRSRASVRQSRISKKNIVQRGRD